MAKRRAFVGIFAMLFLFSADLALAGTGGLKGTFKYKDPSTGVEQVLSYGYVYLRSASKSPPMEKFFSKPDYILGTTAGSPFQISNIPEGTYYIRLLQRKVLGTGNKQYGPPEVGDYTWVQTAPITISAGATLDLGTKYATPFASAPIRISGTIRSSSGTPIAGRYIRAQTVECNTDGYDYAVNQCGPDKFLAEHPTDASGRYTINLRDPGTYYLYLSSCLTTAHDQYSGNRCPFIEGPTVTVAIGDSKTVDFVGN